MSIGFLRLGASLAILAILLVASPFSAAAAGKKTDFSLRIHAGAGFIAAGDVNKGSEGWMDYHRIMAEYRSSRMLGSYRPVHGGFDLGADLIIHLSARFVFSVGLSFLRSARSSEIVSQGVEAIRVVVAPELIALPLRAGLYYALPLSRKFTLTADIGGAYYSFTSLLLKVRYEMHDEIGDHWSIMRFHARTSRLTNIGFYAGFGLERKLGQRLSLIAEFQLRRACFDNFPEASWSQRDPNGQVFNTKGTLYLEHGEWVNEDWNYFVVREYSPIDLSEYEVPRVDFSGVCLQAGVRINI
jgi:hypothetical protein